MDYFPIFTELRGRPCLVVGGGPVALRKARQLLRAGARVTVNAPAIEPPLAALTRRGELRYVDNRFDPALIPEHWLIIAATGESSVNREIARLSAEHFRFCNVVDDGDASGCILPAVIDRSPVVVAISSGGRAPVLTRLLRQRLDEWLPRQTAALARWIGRWRHEVNRHLPRHSDRLQLWHELLDDDTTQDVLAHGVSAADEKIRDALDARQPDAPGEAWLVGAGPGDPELLTRRGLRLLQRADAVLYDALVAPELLELARRDAELVCVGKRAGDHSISQTDINDELIRRVSAGQRVCRLKGGDPFIFGRGGEEVLALRKAGLPFQVVPGITAASGCAASAGIPLTHRGLSNRVSFVTGRSGAGQAEPDWRALTREGGTLAIYMGAHRIDALCETLRFAGLSPDTPAALVANGTRRDQHLVTGRLADLPRKAREIRTGAPTLLIVGDVVRLADEQRSTHRHIERKRS
ncbi:MAG TPA: uroporphyrinogen-III C-methyltransferase [Chromatiales bacterium]|nr:uroporphyrinogen-III C-methyltransferase [Chromatiales bacterium]